MWVYVVIGGVLGLVFIAVLIGITWKISKVDLDDWDDVASPDRSDETASEPASPTVADPEARTVPHQLPAAAPPFRPRHERRPDLPRRDRPYARPDTDWVSDSPSSASFGVAVSSPGGNALFSSTDVGPESTRSEDATGSWTAPDCTPSQDSASSSSSDSGSCGGSSSSDSGSSSSSYDSGSSSSSSSSDW